MSDESAFGVKRPKDVLGLASRSEGGRPLARDAFPAALLAPTWRALLEAARSRRRRGSTSTASRSSCSGPRRSSCACRSGAKAAEYVKALTVSVEKWTASGELAEQLDEEAKRLAQALERADSQPVFDHYTGSGQKPHN